MTETTTIYFLFDSARIPVIVENYDPGDDEVKGTIARDTKYPETLLRNVVGVGHVTGFFKALPLVGLCWQKGLAIRTSRVDGPFTIEDLTGPPTICPHCGSCQDIRIICDWETTSKEDKGNTCTLTEYQCHHRCEGRSFWA